MTDFLWLPEPFLLFAIVVLALAVVTQTVALQVIHFRYGRRLVRGGIRRLMEIVILAFVLAQAVVFATTLMRGVNSVMVPASLEALRWLGWLLVVAVAIWAAARARLGWPIATAAVTGLLLPPLDGLPRGWTGALFILVMAVLIVRAIWITHSHLHKIRVRVSALSMQEAIDWLPRGVMFIDPRGAIQLINRQMRAVMASLTGQVHRNGKEFLADLALGSSHEVTPGILEGVPVYGLPDGTRWMISIDSLEVAGAEHTQIVALDVSQRWRLIEELRARQGELEEGTRRLRQEIDNMGQICRDEELVRARFHAHDLMGQQLTILLRHAKGQTPPERAQLVNTGHDLQAAMAFEPRPHTPDDELETLRDVYAEVGVVIRGPDELPYDTDIAAALVDVIREAATNAVRHGSATRIDVRCVQGPKGWVLTITDNGIASPQVVAEGNGIRGMRYRLGQVGGALSVAVSPGFTVRVVVPEGAAT